MTGDDAERTLQRRDEFTWLDAPYLKAVINALEKVAPQGSRFVGGCVRDSLLGDTPKDFDIATILTPDQIIDAAKAEGLGAVPTGIDHGTVTVISDHQGVEVTTLRADVSTDGRRATVAFTKDWATDAARRDFTINAIYAAPDGSISDPVGGMDDIETRTVRFIGKPEDRIREDALRILRFFRFSARFAQCYDDAGLTACSDLAELVPTLSAERIGAEMMAILALPRAGFAVEAMRDRGVLTQIWPAEAGIATVARLKKCAPESSAALTLAALFGNGNDGIGRALRLSNAEKSIRAQALGACADILPDLAETVLRALIYRLGKDRFGDGAALACAVGKISPETYESYCAFVDGWTVPAFPFSGKDLLARGVKPGPVVASLLKTTESRWIAEDFPAQTRAIEILDKTFKEIVQDI